MSSIYLDVDNIEKTPQQSISTYFSDNDSEDDCDEVFNKDQTKTSPMRGRSVKEYDEQLTALKKENFNLKLRIYFLEERMGSTFRLEDKENIIRKNIEYQVDIETLRKELDEKQDLLCQAVKALELEDNEHKRLISLREVQNLELTEKIEALERDLKSVVEINNELLQKNEKLAMESSQMFQEAFGLQMDKESVKDEIELLRAQLTEVQSQLTEEKEHNSILEHDNREMECLHLRCTNLESELNEKNQRIEELVNELERNGHMVSSCNLRIRTLEDVLTAKNSDILFKEKEAANREKVIQEQAMEIEELRRLVDEGHALCDKEQRQTENLRSAVMTRDNTIADLESKFEKNKSVIRNLEAKLETIVHENKRQKDELQTLKQQKRIRHDFSGDAKISPKKLSYPNMLRPASAGNSSIMDYVDRQDYLNKESQVENWMQDNCKKDNKFTKLEEDYRKACILISNLLEQNKKMEKKSSDVLAALNEKEQQLEEYKRKKRMNFKTPVSANSSQNQPQELQNSTEETDEHMQDKTCSISNVELVHQMEELLFTIHEKEEELKSFTEKYENTIQEKDNRITELENEIINLKFEFDIKNKSIDELKTETMEPKKEKPISWLRVTEEKDKKIEQLECEVRKQTSNLQGIVNKELWDKNREIEKLQNKFTEKLRLKQEEINELAKDITSKNVQLTILKDKISELGVQVNLPSKLLSNVYTSNEVLPQTPEEINTMKERLKAANEECKYLHKTIEELEQKLRNTPERDSDNKISQLKEEYDKISEKYEKSESLRKDTVNLCSLLTTRLEELAYFLDSLLKHKSVLGMLGSKQRSAIKQAVDQSLDLSKSLSVSIMNEEQPIAEISSITELLNNTENYANNSLFNMLPPANDCNISLPFYKHLNNQTGDGSHFDIIEEQTKIISVLRAQIETMKKEIEIRDLEIGKQNADINMSSDSNLIECTSNLQSKNYEKKCASSSNVFITSKNMHQNSNMNKSFPSIARNPTVDDNFSESETWSEPDRYISKARMGLDSETLKGSASNLNQSRLNKSKTKDIDPLESTEEELAHIKTPSKRGSITSVEMKYTIKMLQDDMCSLENKLKEKENEVLSLKALVLELDNKTLETKLHMSEDLAKLRNEKMEIENLLKEAEEKLKLNDEDILTQLKEIEQERDIALHNYNEATVQVQSLESKIKDLEKLLKDNEHEYNLKIQNNDENWKCHLERVENEHNELKNKELEEIKNKYEKEWVPKSVVDKNLVEMTKIKNLLNSSEIKIENLTKSEQELKKKLTNTENSYCEKMISIKRELNESTLRTSQLALERTKLNNEKLKLEAEIRKLELKETTKCNELEEKQKEFNNIKNKLQKQLALIEKDKSVLELRNSELEAVNAELHSRLVKLQTSENVWTPMLPHTNPQKLSEFIMNTKYSLGSTNNILRLRSDNNEFTSDDMYNESNNILNRSAPASYHWLLHNANQNSNDVTDARVASNSSPDLGIESDPGRFSSLETNSITTTRPLLQTLELTTSMNNLLSSNQLNKDIQYCNILSHKKLDKENSTLKQKVSKLELNLEKTMSQLSKINENKIQVEKAVCKQIHKTSKVLRQARANLDSGSENEKL